MARLGEHRPVRDAQCNLCHRQAAESRHDFFLPDEIGAQVCATCHELPHRSTVHPPVRDSKCLECHRAHHAPDRPDDRFMLRGASEKELCGRCHVPQSGQGMDFVHGPVSAVGCTICHSPHSSYEPALLKKPVNETCLECHADVHDRLAEAVSVHAPVGEDCTRCHDAHASNHPLQLRNAPPQLCSDCHAPLEEEFRERPFPHAAISLEEGCGNCHEVHAANLPHLLQKPVDELCLHCHDRALQRPDGTPITAMGELLSTSKFLHGPIREGACEACHDPHGAETFSLLREPYPETFYAPFAEDTYGLCFRCHDPQAFEVENTRTLTRFRNGDTNLHYVHVHRKKGRTCRACHETHASDLPKHMATSVPFGSWDMPIRYQELPQGGSCAPGCHDPKSYDRTYAPPGERRGILERLDSEVDGR